MRKHFLLLFLMALLPLAGWATDYEVQVTTYNGSAVWTGAKPAVQPGWFTASFVGGGSPTAAQKEIIAGGLQVKAITSNPNYNAGAWDYQLELRGDQTISGGGDNFTIYVNSSTTATLTITKFMGALDWGGTLAFVGGDLVYTGEPQALLQTGATATANGTEVPVVYATSATAENWVALADLKETNANTTGYTVYYKVVETDNYVGSNVQTMAGTKAIAKADNTISALAFAGWTYDPAKTAEPSATGDNPAITITATNDAANATFSYKKGTGEYGTWAEKVGGHAGSYTLKATIAESDNYKAGEAEVAFTIAKATAVLNVEGVINTDWTVYDGSTHQLFKQAATATVGESQTPVTVKYTYKYCPPGGSYDASWATARTSITNSNLKKTNAGRYRLNISVDGNDDYNGASNKVGDAFPVLTVAQADIPTESYTAPAAKTLMDTGAEQELITAGTWASTSYGNFEYSLNNTDWATTVPVGSAAGGYTVYAKIDPTDAVNYKPVTFDAINVTIAEKTTVTIAAKANQTFGYGTTPVIEYDVTWTDKREDNLNVENLTWGWYTNSDCSTPATVDGNGNFTVGDYFVKATGATVTGTTAASQEIVYTPVAVKITAGQVTAEISGTAIYGSLPTFTLTHVSGLSPAEAENFNAANNLSKVTVKKDGAVVNELENVAPNNAGLAALAKGEYDLEATASCGNNYAVVVTGKKLTVGAKSIAGAVIDVTTDADAIVYNNKAWGTVNSIAFTVTETSGIDAADYDVTYSNNVNAGTATITLTGKRNYTGTKTQNFTIKKAALTIKANNTTWIYGTTEPTYAVTVEGQAEGETALAVGGTLAGIDGALTVVRTSNETVGTHAGALVAKFGSAQPAASDNYTIAYETGDLQIAPAAATIQLKAAVAATLKSEYGVSNDAAKALIQTALRDINNYEAKSGITAAELASVNVGSVTCDLADAEYQVNESYSFTATGATSTNYGITIDLEGVYFTVTPAPITLYAKDQAINWSTDPTAQPNETVEDATVAIAAGALKYTDALTDVVASVNIASTNVGNNNITLTAANNANYNITVNSDGTDEKKGVLTITGAAAIALGGGNDLQLISDYAGQNVNVTINFAGTRNGRTLGGTRDWVKENWVTLTLPFDITVAELSQKLGYAIVNEIDDTKTKVDGTSSEFYGKLTMKGAYGEDYLPANKPILVKIADDIANVGTTGVVDFGSRLIVAPTDLIVDAGKGAKFVGTYSPRPVDSNDDANIWFLIGGGYTKWAYIMSTSSASWTIAPFEAYIDMSNLPAEASRNMTFYFEDIDGTITAIKSINVDDMNQKLSPEGWYNLNGVKLQGAPTQKGVYIKDGKKVVIK